MMWSRLSIGKKLFIAIMATVFVVIAFVTLMIFLSMRTGFNEYILRAELERFDPLIQILSQQHDPNNPGWPEFANDPRLLRELISQAMPPRYGQRLNGERGQFRNDGLRNGGFRNERAQPQNNRPRNNNDINNNRMRGQNGLAPRRDPQNIINRFALLDANENIIVGVNASRKDFIRSDIIGLDAKGNQSVIGFVALSKPTANQRANIDASVEIYFADQLKTLLLTVFVALLVSMFAAYLLSRQFTQPVERLVSGTKRLSRGDYDFRLAQTSEDEFGNLVKQFNLLAAQLNQQEKSERQWLSDTSHELQTPLAVLKAEIEALQDGVRKADKKTLSTLHQSVERLSALVKDISQLSHAREGRIVSKFAKDDLTALAQDAATKADAIMEEAGLTLERDLDSPILLDCDAMRIGQLIDNLLSNSRRYTTAPGTVKISTKEEKDYVVLKVEDSNSPPPQEAMDKIFDRFYRADQSRTRTSGETSGSGLGLSICKLIVQAHQGTIHAKLSPLGGLAVIVTLPKVPKNNDTNTSIQN